MLVYPTKIVLEIVAFSLAVQQVTAMFGGKETAAFDGDDGNSRAPLLGSGSSSTTGAANEDSRRQPQQSAGFFANITGYFNKKEESSSTSAASAVAAASATAAEAQKNAIAMKARLSKLVEDTYHRRYKPILENDVLLRFVKLVNWSNESDECDADEILHKYYFRFNWNKEQCRWVKPSEKQFVFLQVEYELYNAGYGGQSSRKEVFCFYLWDTEQFPAEMVKHFLEGKGQFWLDYNCVGDDMLLEQEEHDEVECLAKPGARCALPEEYRHISDDFNVNGPQHQSTFPLITKAVALESVKLIKWTNKEAKVVYRSCVAEIFGKHTFIFNWTECFRVKYELFASTKMHPLSLEVVYKYEEAEHQKVPVRYDLWNTELFPAETVYRWLEGKGGQFVLDHNCALATAASSQHGMQLLFEHGGLTLAKPGARCPRRYQQRPGAMNPFNLSRYPLITKPVVLQSVTLIQWNDPGGKGNPVVGTRPWENLEANKAVARRCEATIVGKHNFKLDWNEKCYPHLKKSVHEDGGLMPLSLEVVYKYENDEEQLAVAAAATAETSNPSSADENHQRSSLLLAYRYDLWDKNGLFNDFYVGAWLGGGNGKFWIDHNKYPEPMLTHMSGEENANAEGLCYAKPTPIPS